MKTKESFNKKNCAYVHRAAAGETLYKIARRYGVDYGRLMALNGITNPYQLKAGTEICIPPVLTSGDRHCTGFYVIREGDTLYSIARRFGVTLDDLLAANSDIDPYHMHIGMKLCIPPKSNAGSPGRPDSPGQRPPSGRPDSPGQRPPSGRPDSPGQRPPSGRPDSPGQRPPSGRPDFPGQRPPSGRPDSPGQRPPVTGSGSADHVYPRTVEAEDADGKAASAEQGSSGAAAGAGSAASAANTAVTPGNHNIAADQDTVRNSAEEANFDSSSLADEANFDSYVVRPLQTTDSEYSDFSTPPEKSVPAAASAPPHGDTADMAPVQDADTGQQSENSEDIIYTVLNPAEPFASDSAMPYVSDTMPDGILYRVEQGESLTDILRKFGICFSALDYCNSSVDFDRDLTGLTLNIPYGDKFCISPNNQPYVIRRNDSLDTLSLRFHISTDDLLRLNPTRKPEDFSNTGSRISISDEI